MSIHFENLIGDGPAIHQVRPVTGNVKVAREGTVVVLQMGNGVVRFKYQDAMKVGQWLMAKGCEAKALAGDKNRIFVDR